MITVHSIPGSPYGRAVLVTCLEKGAPHRHQRVAPGQHKSPEHLARHPFGRVPAIEDDGFELYETQAIIRYVDAAYPGPSLTPSDPKAKALMDQAIGVIDCYFFADNSAKTLGFNRIVAPKLGFPVNEEAAQAAIPGTRHVLGVLGAMVKDRPYIAGETFTLADIHAGTQVDLLSSAPEVAEMIAGSPLEPWLQRLRARPSFAATTWEQVAAMAA
jgi:glutathione S-transferase